MLIVQDVHVVVGRDEMSFEEAYRAFAGELEAQGTARLALFGWLPHGAGEGYEAVVLTVVDDVEALVVYQAALADGKLAADRLALDAMTHEAGSTVGVLAASSTLMERALTGAHDHAPTLLRLDTYELDASRLATAMDDPATLAGASGEFLELEAAWAPLLGGLDTPTLTTLSRVTSNAGLRDVLADTAADAWPGQPTPGADVPRQSRLVRSVAWSPVH